MKIAIYPGSFDPPTKGHLDIIKRASKIFDKVVICIMVNPDKTPTFSLEQKIEMLQLATAKISNVFIDSFTGLLVNYAKDNNITTIIKGIRSSSDLEIEHQMATLNASLNKNVETLFLLCKNEHRFISSTVVRQLLCFNGDIKDLVHHTTYDYILNLKENC